MVISPRRLPVGNGNINILSENGVVWGFNEVDVCFEDTVRFLGGHPVIQLKQIHSADIWSAADIPPKTSGDGIILTQKEHIAIIKTADCVPLFFWNSTQTLAGVIHIGWRGLVLGIDKHLMDNLRNIQLDFTQLRFFFGPSISGSCYSVGEDVYSKFRDHPYRDRMFVNRDRNKFLLDLKVGIRAELTDAGISPRQICDSDICNHCATDRFPSYRRDGKSDVRIINFILLT